MARGQLVRGRVSWYGGPNDSEDNNIPALAGASNENPGIAMYDPSAPGGRGDTLGGYWRVRGPDGRVAVIQQTDVGPHPSTNRKIDVNAAAVPVFGYTETNFPTESIWGARYLGKDDRWRRVAGRLLGEGSGQPPAVRGARASRGGSAPTLRTTAPQGADTGALLALLSQRGQQRPVFQSAPLSRPEHAAGALMPAGYVPRGSSYGGAPQDDGLAAQLAAIAQLFGPSSEVTVPRETVTVSVPGRGRRSGGGRAPSGEELGELVMGPGANRPGAHLTKLAGNAVRRIAAEYGKPLTIGTATNHRQLTTTGNQSDHWTGFGADIPATGQTLTQIGDAAMRAFGQKPQGGGLHRFNWRGNQVQLIYNVSGDENGGDHTNHLHVGIRPL